MTFDSLYVGDHCLSSVLTVVSLLAIKIIFGERDLSSVIFDKLSTETTSKSWLGEGEILRRCSIKLGRWRYYFVCLRNISLTFCRSWEGLVSSRDVDGICLANWGIFIGLFGSLGSCCEVSNDIEGDGSTPTSMSKLSIKFGSGMSSALEFF